MQYAICDFRKPFFERLERCTVAAPRSGHQLLWKEWLLIVTNIAIVPSRQGGQHGTWTTSNTFTTLAKRRKVSALSFFNRVVLSSSWSFYLASTSPMHLVLNFLLNIHVALQDLQGIKEKWLSLRNIKWLSLFPLYLRRPLPNVSSLSLLMYSPSFAKNQWWSVFHISESFNLLK